MSMVSKLMAGSAIALALSVAPAFADGMEKKSYAAAAHECDNSGRFGGAYVGASVGSGSLTSTLTDRFNSSFGTDSSQTQDGWVLGGQAGYNMQKCNTVFGVEADFAWTDLNSGRGFGPYAGVLNAGATDQLNRETNWLGSVRTRAGVVVGDLLLYATGGIALADFKTTGTRTLANGTTGQLFQMSDNRFGWVTGVGTEYAISDKISLTGSALYYDFGTRHTDAGPNIGGFDQRNYDERQTLWVTRMGVNIKLGERAPHYEPMK